jgi:hypothetical protein
MLHDLHCRGTDEKYDSDNGTNGREVRYEERIKKMEQRREVRE